MVAEVLTAALLFCTETPFTAETSVTPPPTSPPPSPWVRLDALERTCFVDTSDTDPFPGGFQSVSFGSDNKDQ
jgi:hypothetical protein